MVVESSSAWLTLHDPFIGVHLEHSATIFAVVRYSMTLLCSVEGEHIFNSIRTMRHHNAPEVSFKHTAGRPGIAVYLRRILHLSDVCEHRRIGELANSSLAVQMSAIPPFIFCTKMFSLSSVFSLSATASSSMAACIWSRTSLQCTYGPPFLFVLQHG
jgi:hypothetical protein